MNTRWPTQAKLCRLHADEGGTISFMTVIAVLLFTMLLGMVMNVGRHVDGKIRMQNAADASAYSGGIVLARGMNTLAFSNHLLCDVFALTAFMREARDGNAQRYTPVILDAWEHAGQLLAASEYPKFEELGRAIQAKVPLERELVRAFSEWAAASSAGVLPMLEQVLADEMIPDFQRTVVAVYPDIAQQAAMEIALRNGQPNRGRGPMLGSLWRSGGWTVGGEYETFDHSLPVVDPLFDLLPDQDRYLRRAREQRARHARIYLGVSPGRAHWRWYHGNWHARSWNDEALVFFDREVKMSQFSMLWRSFTCGYLKALLEEEYPDRNLPHLMHTRGTEVYSDRIGPTPRSNTYLEEHFTFVAVTYWKQLPERLPGLFRNPTDSDVQAYAAVRVFIPRRRLRWFRYVPGRSHPDPLGGVGHQFPDHPDSDPEETSPDSVCRWYVGRESLPTHWDLFNQRWTCQLVPATLPGIAHILQTQLPLLEYGDEPLRVPHFGEVDGTEIGRISQH